VTDYVFYPVTGDGTSQSTAYTWGTGQINFDTGADWAQESTLAIGTPPSSTGTVPGSGTGTSGGTTGQDSVGLVAGEISPTYFALYTPDPSHGDPYIASNNYPVDVLLNSGSVELGNLLLAGFNTFADVSQFPTLEIKGATLDVTGDVDNSETVTFPPINLGFFSVDSATASGGGTIDIETGGSVEIGGTVETSIDMNFSDTGGNTLQLDQPTAAGSSFLGSVTGIADGNAIILPNVAFTSNSIQTTGTYLAGAYVVTVGGLQSISFDVSGLTDANELQVKQLGTGIELVTCFAAGTHIRTPSGSVAVEALREGDLVSLAGTDDALPVRWIGRRRIDCRRHPNPEMVRPVRVAAGIFGEAVPSRDVFLSPDHAVLVDGCLVPVKYLVDGDGIAQIQADAVTYYHVELARHAAILAEDLPVETYLDTGDRIRFDIPGEVVTLFPPTPRDGDFPSRLWEAKGFAPLVTTGPIVAAICRRLRDRSSVLREARRLPAAA
jgi:hypothetical protein